MAAGADRFWGEFSRSRAGRSGHPGDPNGTRRPEPDQPHGQECLEWCPICRSAELVRGNATPDVLNQFATIQNEAFNVLKAFLTAYAEKATGPSTPEPGFGPDGSRSKGRDPKTDDSGTRGVDIPIE